MKIKLKITVWLLIVQIILISCSSEQAKAPESLIEVKDENINNQILVHAPEHFNSHKTYEAVIVEIISYSDRVVIFPNNYNLRIFVQTNSGWKEIKEVPTARLPKDDIVFSPTSSVMRDLAVFPDLDDVLRSYTLRIYVIGTMETEADDVPVAAYVDIELHP